jgi:hypothetical protein
MASAPGTCCANRLFEWIMVSTLLGMGLLMLIWPSTMGASSFRYILQVLTPGQLTAAYLSIGVFRAAALVANGSAPAWGPSVRAVGAIAGASIWLQMDVALIIWTVQNGLPPSPGMAMFTSVIVGEITSTYRAMRDGRTYWR